MTAPKIANHVEQAQARMLSQYKGKPRMEGLIEALSSGSQSIEDALFDMYWKRSVNSSTGTQLDVVGNIVGEPRQGWNDAQYRIRILGKIGVNISQGGIQDLIDIFLLIMQCTKAQYIPVYPAECMIFGDFAPIDTEQLLVDGNMEAPGVAEWTPVNDALLTKENVSPHGGLQNLKIAFNETPDPGAQQDALAIGEYYWLKGRFRTPVMGAQMGVILNGATPILTINPWLNFYEFDVIFQATAQTLTLGSDLAAPGYVEYDSCSCRRLLLNTMQDVYTQCTRVIPVGVKLSAIGWFEGGEQDPIWGDDDEDDENDDLGTGKAFSFEGDPNGLGFGDLNDPTVGGKFASIFVW